MLSSAGVHASRDRAASALISGRRRNAYIDGLALAESEALLDELWSYATRDELTWYNTLAGRRPGAVGQPLHHAPPRPFDPSSTPRHAPHADQGRRAARVMRRFSVSKTVLLIICLMYLILYVDRVNISTAAPLIKADLGLSNTQLGLAFSAFAYPYALFQLIGGYFGDKFGARLTLCVSGLIVCAATAATGAVGGFA